MFQQRRERRNLALSPQSAKRLVDQFASHETDSSSSESPDSLYSNGSPRFQDQAFEFDREEEIEQHDQEDYESLMAESEAWQTPAWGAWPEMGQPESRWSPSPVMDSSPSRGTIISISPAGSLNSRRSGRSGSGKSNGSPFRSLPRGKTPSEDSRRGSDPSLLGFELNSPRRHPVVRGWNAGRRRSSLLSNASALDAGEDARLRNIASMEMLGRRFSEVVEVTHPASDDERFDTAVVRRALSQWSPYSSSIGDDDDDESEIRTAPYIPTPPGQHVVPTVLSNFPLPTVAAEPEDMWEDMSSASSPTSPAYRTRRLPTTARRGPPRMFATPPPPEQPANLLRQRSRPNLNRAITDYQFPARVDDTPEGVAPPPRPTLSRSISTPFFSASGRDREAASLLSKRAKGSFPVTRQAPLGVSPLRESLRRQSVVSDGGSRRGSLAEGSSSRRPSVPDRRPSVPDRRFSTATKDNDLRRVSIDRRMSIEARRMSVDARRPSVGASGSTPSRESSRKSSASSISVRRSSGTSAGRRSSGASRKSSIVSVSDFAYLAPEIVIEAAPPLQPTVFRPLPEIPKLRRNAPPSIILPEFTFPPSSPSAGPLTSTSDLTTPRYHPMDSFLGKLPSPGMPSTPSSLRPVSPLEESEKTPTIPHSAPPPSPKSAGIMDRPRPISPPEFGTTFLPRFRGVSSPKLQDREDGHALEVTPMLPPSSRSVTPDARPLSRKAVPRLTEDELKAEELRDELLRLDKLKASSGGLDGRGVMFSALTKDEAMLRGAAAHRRAISIEQTPAPFQSRPPNRRQATVPVDLDQVKVEQKRANRKSHIVFEESAWRSPTYLDASSPETLASARISPIQASSARVSPTHYAAASISPVQSPLVRVSPTQPALPAIKEKVINKRTSVTFSEETRAINNESRPSISRASSFTRFFKGRPHSVAAPSPSMTRKSSSPNLGSNGSSRLARPISVDGASASKKVGGTPRRSAEDEEGRPDSRRA